MASLERAAAAGRQAKLTAARALADELGLKLGSDPEADHEAKLAAGQQLSREMAAEMGPVTEAEQAELRKVWPPDA